MLIGNIDFNLNSDLTENEFQTLFKGKINIPLDEAFKIYSKHKVKKVEQTKPTEKKARRRRK